MQRKETFEAHPVFMRRILICRQNLDLAGAFLMNHCNLTQVQLALHDLLVFFWVEKVVWKINISDLVAKNLLF